MKQSEVIVELLKNIDAKINHIEDVVADNRAIIVKLVKQGNQVVEFLKQLEIDIDEEHGIEAPPSFTTNNTIDLEKAEKTFQVIEEYIDKKKELKEFEKELKKNKDKLTPGQVGES
tara:strand:+ start:179 stop:526 length:348 start_codon:yes stop_codon:yes gene_type:complete